MSKLLMISGDRALASGKRGAFYNTLEEFHKYWDRIDIICPGIGKLIHTQGWTLRVDKLPEFGNVFVHPSPWPLVFQPGWIFKKGLEIYREQKFDLITVHEYPPFYNGMGARFLWQKIRVPYVLEIHHIPGYPKPADLKEKVYARLFRNFIKYDASKAVAVRVVNQNQVPDFLKKSGVPAEKIKYIPSLYIDLNIFKPLNTQKDYDLIFVGRMEENKGLNLFLEAVRKIHAKALIVGSGSLAKNTKLRVKDLGLEDRVTIHGWAKDSLEVAELLNKSKILVMPSYNEGGPRVVLEAMACGLPVLATPVGIVPDIIKNEESGVIINWNSSDIAEKAKHLLENQEEYEKYRLAGLEIAKRFEKKEAIKNYAEELKNIIS